MIRTTRLRSMTALALVAMLVLGLLAGCAAPDKTADADRPANPAQKPIAIKIGTLATEDSLPLWAAETMGYFATQGIPSIEIVSFQSAQERDVAFASGAIDAFMGDVIASANLEASGKKSTIATVMLGADQSQGRFGIVVPPKSQIADVKALAGVPVGTSSATIQEYVLDGLMAEAKVASSAVKTEEVKKVPVRYELLMAGKLKAAALPEPYLTLAEQGGATIVGDDTKAASNLSQTVLVFADDYLAKAGGAATREAVLAAWDLAVNDINKAPDAYHDLLAEKAQMPESLAATYKINVYPTAQLPTVERVDATLGWMRAKGYLKGDLTAADLLPAQK